MTGAVRFLLYWIGRESHFQWCWGWPLHSDGSSLSAPCGSRRLVMLSSDHHHPNQLFHLCLQNGHFHIASAFMSWNSSIENLPSSVRTVWLPEVILERWKNCLILSLISFPVPSYLHWRLEVCFVFLSLLFLNILKPLISWLLMYSSVAIIFLDA